MKKYLAFFGLLVFSLFASNAIATYSSGYSDPIFTESLNFKATLESDGSVQMNWSTFTSNLKYYKVVRSQSNSNPVYPDDGYIYYSNTTTSYTDYKVPSGLTYYRVCAITSENKRYCSPVTKIVTDSGPVEDQKADSISLKASSTDGKITLMWTLNGESPKGYKIAKSTVNEYPTYPVMDGDTYKYISDPNTQYYKDYDVKPDVTYFYRACIYEGGYCGVYSNTIKITAEGADIIPIEPYEEIIPIDTEGGIVLEATATSEKVTLKWSVDRYSSNGYKVAKSAVNKEPTYPVMNGDTYKYIADPATKYYKDGSVKEGNTYYYRVCFYEGGKCGSYSNAIAVTIPVASDIVTIKEPELIKEVVKEVVSKDDIVIKKYTSFSDVKSGDWFKSHVEEYVSRGIIQGYADGSFRPNDNISRAEMAKIMSLLDGKTSSSKDQIFCDVDTDDWFHSHVSDIYYENLTNGYVGGACSNNRIFKPNVQLTRGEAIKVILLYFDTEIDPLSSGDTTGFSDVSNNNWIAPYARKAFQLQLIQGYDDGTFRPSTKINRAEFIKILSIAEKKLSK